MKCKDIIPGQDYGMSAPNAYDPNRYCERVHVLAAGVQLRNRKDGVIVRYESGWKQGREETIRAAMIYRPWHAVEILRQETEQGKVQAELDAKNIKATKEKEFQTLKDRLEKLGLLADVQCNAPYVSVQSRGYGGDRWGVSERDANFCVNPEILAKILDELENK